MRHFKIDTNYEEDAMKRNQKMAGIAVAAVAAAMVMAGCGANDAENATWSSIDTPAESKAENTTGKTTEAASESTAENGAGNAVENSDGQTYADVENGTAKVKYTGKGDVPGYFELSQVLTVGESYTVNEICDALKKIEDFQQDAEITYSKVDCGSDGEEELLVEAQLSAGFGLDMIIKKINDGFVICYDQSTTERSYVTVNADGTIESGGASAANIHDVDYAYVDASGEYKFFYGVSETLSLMETYDIYKGDSVTSISTEGIDAEHMAVLEYYFEQNYEERNSFYSFYTFDDSYSEVETEAGKADIAELGVRFKDEGFQIYDSEGIKAVLNERAQEIGYPGRF